MELVKELDYAVNAKELFDLADSIIRSNDIVRRMNGLSLQHRKGVGSPWDIVDGLESLKVYDGVSESDFNQTHEKFLNTTVENLINDFQLFRTRVMIMGRKTCYSLHSDTTWRLHVPIVTNTDCLFYFPEHKEQYHLELGKVYLVNTREKHTFINASFEERWHLVGCVNYK